MSKLKVSLFPKQYSFVNSTKSINLYSGGVGAGKTLAEIVVALKYALEYPGINILFVSPTYRMLKDVVLREAENLIPKNLYKHFLRGSYPEIEFYLKNGKTSKILFRAFDKPGKTKGINAGLAVFDELTEGHEEIFEGVLDRLRQKNMPNRFFGATNPSDFENFVYKKIVNIAEKRLKGFEDISFISTTSFDNFKLPTNYLKRLKLLEHTDPARYNQMVLGLWGNFAQNTIGAFPTVKNFETPYKVAFIDPSFSDSEGTDKTSLSIVEVVPNSSQESYKWQINFTGRTWNRSISDYEVQKELLIFLDQFKPVDTCLESQLSDSTKVFIDSLKSTEKDLNLTVKNSWSYKRQSSNKSKQSRIIELVASNKYRIKVLENTQSEYLNEIVRYSKSSKHDDEIDSLAGSIELWYSSEILQNYIKHSLGVF